MPARKPNSQSRARELKRSIERRIAKTNVLRFLGVKLIHATSRHVRLRLRVGGHLLQVHRVVHGGVVATLADTAGGLATYMSVPPGTRVATVEMKINFLEAIDSGVVTADARVIRLGRNFAIVDCDVRDAKRRLAGKALMTFAHDAASNPRWRRR